MISSAKIGQIIFSRQMRYEKFVNKGPVKIASAEVVVAAMIYHLNFTVANPHHRSVKGSTTKAIPKPKRTPLRLAKAVGQRGSDRLLQ